MRALGSDYRPGVLTNECSSCKHWVHSLAASARFLSCNCLYSRSRCLLTERGVIPRRTAISLSVNPTATSDKTSACRRVTPDLASRRLGELINPHRFRTRVLQRKVPVNGPYSLVQNYTDCSLSRSHTQRREAIGGVLARRCKLAKELHKR